MPAANYLSTLLLLASYNPFLRSYLPNHYSFILYPMPIHDFPLHPQPLYMLAEKQIQSAFI